jgi:hypothetical protein
MEKRFLKVGCDMLNMPQQSSRNFFKLIHEYLIVVPGYSQSGLIEIDVCPITI